MRGFSIVLVLFAAIVMPQNLVAQEEDESPMMLRLSFYMCDTNQLEAAMDAVESREIPVWQELVDEGMVQSHGYITHAWASEWNIGIYTLAESIDAVIAASAEAGSRIAERYGDEPGVFDRACPHHRDGFYFFGPSTEGDDEEEETEGS